MKVLGQARNDVETGVAFFGTFDLIKQTFRTDVGRTGESQKRFPHGLKFVSDSPDAGNAAREPASRRY
jgi:hypothetical protein